MGPTDCLVTPARSAMVTWRVPPRWNIERVLVAVDSAQARRAVQAALPRVLTNAWTQVGDLGISRHRFVVDQACACCMYLPEGGQPNEDEIIAGAIGLPGEVREVRKLLVEGARQSAQIGSSGLPWLSGFNPTSSPDSRTCN